MHKKCSKNEIFLELFPTKLVLCYSSMKIKFKRESVADQSYTVSIFETLNFTGAKSVIFVIWDVMAGRSV